MTEPGILLGRLPAMRIWEPPIVTTLRRYVRRGASPALLLRIAGGPRSWRDLNLFWNLDGRGVRARSTLPRLAASQADTLQSLSFAERRIALVQLAEECAETRAPFPAPKVVAGLFGVTHTTIANDLKVLRASGEISWRMPIEEEAA